MSTTMWEAGALVFFIGNPPPVRRFIFDLEVTNFIATAYQWQTLLGAAIALPLAFFAIMVPIWQEGGRIRRRGFAARASLPIRLNEISIYAVKVLEEVASVRTPDGVNRQAMARLAAPQIPPGLVDALERTIEGLDNRRVNRRLARIIQQLQVLNTRVMGLSPMDGDKAWVDTLMIQAATVYAQASSLYEYARLEKSTTNRRIEWSELSTVFNLSKLFGPRFTDVTETIGRYAESGMDPERENSRHVLRVRRAWLRLTSWPKPQAPSRVPGENDVQA